MSAPVPRAYIYKYADPFTGKPVWRRDGDLWNGQRPSETIPLYDASAIAEAVAREREAQAAEIARLRDTLRITAITAHQLGATRMELNAAIAELNNEAPRG